MQSTTTSLPLAIKEILDKVGSKDSFFPAETAEIRLPLPSTPESLALETSIRNLVIRFQELEQKSIHSSPPPQSPTDARPVTKLLQNVKENGKEENKKGACVLCGHRLDIGPLTPDETPPVVDATESYVPQVNGSSKFASFIEFC
jgi:hypothetical protein